MDVSGLGLKAYLIQEVAAGSAGNAYAPFYVWTDPDALAASTGKGRDSAESQRLWATLSTDVDRRTLPPRPTLRTDARLRHEDGAGLCIGR